MHEASVGDDVRQPSCREVRVGLLVSAERMVLGDPPEELFVASVVALAAVAVEVLGHAPAKAVELAVAELVARDELVQRVECLGGERAVAGERPSGLDEVEDCPKIVVAQGLQTGTNDTACGDR